MVKGTNVKGIWKKLDLELNEACNDLDKIHVRGGNHAGMKARLQGLCEGLRTCVGSKDFPYKELENFREYMKAPDTLPSEIFLLVRMYTLACDGEYILLRV